MFFLPRLAGTTRCTRITSRSSRCRSCPNSTSPGSCAASRTRSRCSATKSVAAMPRVRYSTRMATKSDFTEEEWKAMQSGISGAGLFVALVDRGFFDNFKEANALAQHLRAAHEKNDNALVRELADGLDRPFGLTASPAEVEQSTIAAITEGVAVLEAKSPDDLPAYRALVLDVAESVAAAAKGVSPQENQALERIRSALAAAG